jgi:hypothetical protein
MRAVSVSDAPAGTLKEGKNMNQKSAMSAENNKTILLRLFSELRKGNTSAIDEFCSPKFAFHSPNFPNWPAAWTGRER